MSRKDDEGTDAIKMYFASKLRDLRTNLGETQEEFARRLGRTRVTLANLERARQEPSLSTIFKLSEKLGVEPSEFIPPMDWYKKHKGKKVIVKTVFELK